jgi:hypothetical protein
MQKSCLHSLLGVTRMSNQKDGVIGTCTGHDINLKENYKTQVRKPE